MCQSSGSHMTLVTWTASCPQNMSEALPRDCEAEMLQVAAMAGSLQNSFNTYSLEMVSGTGNCWCEKKMKAMVRNEIEIMF